MSSPDPLKRKKQRHEHYLKNKEKQKAQMRAYYEKNKATIRQAQKKYRAENLEKIKKQRKDSYTKRPKKIKQTKCKWDDPLSRGEYYKKYHQQERERIRNSRYVRKYNITSEDISRILKIQGYRCAICGSKLGKYVIDHDHKNNFVRGILCSLCNSFLGMAREDIKILNSGIKYLKRNGGNYGESTQKDTKMESQTTLW